MRNRCMILNFLLASLTFSEAKPNDNDFINNIKLGAVLASGAAKSMIDEGFQVNMEKKVNVFGLTAEGGHHIRAGGAHQTDEDSSEEERRKRSPIFSIIEENFSIGGENSLPVKRIKRQEDTMETNSEAMNVLHPSESTDDGALKERARAMKRKWVNSFEEIFDSILKNLRNFMKNPNSQLPSTPRGIEQSK